MKKNGFSLIELMVAMGVLTIIATVAVPKVQMWNARNKGLKTVMELISDYSKAKSVAGYTIVSHDDNGKIEIPVNIPTDEDTETTGGSMNVYMGIRNQTAIVFRKSEYGIYQKQSMLPNDWADSNPSTLKINKLPETVTIEKVNVTMTPPNDITSFNTVLNFTSNGKLKNKYGAIIVSSTESDQCNETPSVMIPVFSVVIRSKISLSDDDSIWYRVNIDRRGDYTVCTVFSSVPGVPNFASYGTSLDI